jgi:hypothetical protein
MTSFCKCNALLLLKVLFCKIKRNVCSQLMKGVNEKMTRIPDDDRDIMEKAMYLPMVLIILNRDITVIENSPFKLKQPYLDLIEETMKEIQRELAEVKLYMKKNKLQVIETKRDDAFTLYRFIYKGYEENHNYFNPRIRNKVQELMEAYLLKKHLSR